MPLHPRHSRASSVPSSPTRPPLANTLKPTTPLSKTRSHDLDPGPAAAAAAEGANKASLIQPRIAVVLNVPRPWHPWLFALRLCSILPAIWWGTPSVLQVLLRVLEVVVGDKHGDGYGRGALREEDEVGGGYAELSLATIWCFASGYLSFFFTDCLMSRWLINYTPQATIVRLLTINAVNAYVTSTVLSLAGGFHDSRLLLPGWIGIATTLTVCYHITHQKINIRKETSTSVNVFSIASYLSMITLLVHMHTYQKGYPVMPIITRTLLGWNETKRIAGSARDTLEHYREL